MELTFLPKDIITQEIGYLDLPTAAGFFQTCKEMYGLYQSDHLVENPVDVFLRNKEKCYLLTPDQHCNALIHYAQKNNESMITFIISNESNENRDMRDYVLSFFEYGPGKLKNISHNIHAYRAVRNNSGTCEDVSLLKKIFFGPFCSC